MKKLTLALSIAAFGLVAACGEQEAISDAVPNVPEKIDYKVDNQVALLEKLPSKAVAYVRIPSLVNMMTVPQADALYPVLAMESMQTQWVSILEGINNNLISKVENPQMRELIRIFIHKQATPIEVAVLEGSIGPLTPELVLQTKLNLGSIDELKKMLEQLVVASQGQPQQAQLVNAPDESGNFTIAIGPVKAFGYFDLSNKDFVIYGGLTALESNLTKYREGSLEKRADLLNFEKQFDTSGAGFAVWADTKRLWEQLSPIAPPEIKSELEKFNIQDMKFAYLGTASKDGHGSMRAHVQYKEDSDNILYFPTSKTALDVQVALPLNFAASIPLPNQQHLMQLIKLDEKYNESPSLGNDFAEMTEALKAEVDLNLLFSSFGNSALIIDDKAGTWTSLPIQNNEGFDALIATTQKTLGATLTKTNVEGLEIVHYVLPGLTKLALQMNPDEKVKKQMSAWLIQLLSGENMHLYWVREGENLILASLPQILIARERHKSSTTASQWIESQNIKRDESTFSIAANAEDLPKTAYHMYLSAVQSLSDIAGVEPNLLALPLAEDLGLSDTGRLGVALNTGKDSTSLIFDYEQTPIDYLSGGNALSVVAVTGILAAVAIPAYQDYTVRAKSTQALIMSSQLQAELLEYFLENGYFPDQSDAEQLFIETETADIYFDAEEEVIKIIFSPNISKKFIDAELHLVPNTDQHGQITWSCSNISAPRELIPSSCRN